MHTTGVVVDSESLEPLYGVSVGKYAEETDNPYTRRNNTDSTGRYEFNSVGGMRCDHYKLYFSLKDYEEQMVKFKPYHYHDTIFLKPKIRRLAD